MYIYTLSEGERGRWEEEEEVGECTVAKGGLSLCASSPVTRQRHTLFYAI